MSSLKNMIESILITEISRLYERAAGPNGLGLEDVRKLEIFVKIKDLENAEDTGERKVNPHKKTLEELIALATKSKNEQRSE